MRRRPRRKAPSARAVSSSARDPAVETTRGEGGREQTGRQTQTCPVMRVSISHQPKKKKLSPCNHQREASCRAAAPWTAAARRRSKSKSERGVRASRAKDKPGQLGETKGSWTKKEARGPALPPPLTHPPKGRNERAIQVRQQGTARAEAPAADAERHRGHAGDWSRRCEHSVTKNVRMASLSTTDEIAGAAHASP